MSSKLLAILSVPLALSFIGCTDSTESVTNDVVADSEGGDDAGPEVGPTKEAGVTNPSDAGSLDPTSTDQAGGDLGPSGSDSLGTTEVDSVPSTSLADASPDAGVVAPVPGDAGNADATVEGGVGNEVEGGADATADGSVACSDTFSITTTCVSGPCARTSYVHTFVVTWAGFEFAGTGTVVGDNGSDVEAAIEGSVVDDTLTFQFVYTNYVVGYTVDGVADVATDGTASGTGSGFDPRGASQDFTIAVSAMNVGCTSVNSR